MTEAVDSSGVGLRERAISLVEAGFNQEAVAMYGTSVENVLRILKTGKIQSIDLSDPDGPSYRQAITEGGKKNLYYFLIIGPAIKKAQPNLFEKMLPAVGMDAQQLLNVDAVKLNATDYAEMQSVEDYFKAKTGVDLEYGQIEHMVEIIRGLNPEMAAKLLSPQVAVALQASLGRKGVIVYFNSRIFDLAKVEPGFEGEVELTAVSDDLLDLSVISGIEVLSEEEKAEILII